MRDQLLAAVTARLERIVIAQDPALALKWGARRDARRLARILPDDDSDLEALCALGWFYWYRYLALPESREHDALGDAIRTLTPCFIADADGLPEAMLAFLAEDATETAFTWLEQAVNTTDLALITATVLLWQRIVASTLGKPYDGPEHQSDLAITTHLRHGWTSSTADLDEQLSHAARHWTQPPATTPIAPRTCPTSALPCMFGSNGRTAPGIWMKRSPHSAEL